MYARDYRKKARENLSGNWGLSIGMAVVVCVLGGLSSRSDFLPFTEKQNILHLTDFLNTIFGPSDITIGFVRAFGLAQFLLGGIIQMGYAKYLLKQYDRLSGHRRF